MSDVGAAQLLLMATLISPVFHGQCQLALPPAPQIPGSAGLYYMGTNLLGEVTNGPAVEEVLAVWRTNIAPRYPALLSNLPTNLPLEVLQRALLLRTQTVTRVTGFTNIILDHFLPGSLSEFVWTNVIAHTNGRTVRIWTERRHPEGWPQVPPVVRWDHQCLMWGMKGETALSPCWEAEGAPGQIPITLITRRHGYTRGHDMGPDGFHRINAGKKVWFVTADDQVVEVTIAREVVRTVAQGQRDYTILLFTEDVPQGIEAIRVVNRDDFAPRYPIVPSVPWVVFKTEQLGQVSADLPGFLVPAWKGGDSGSPDLLPLPGELVFTGGRATSGASAAMQADMDELCREQGLNPAHYQLNWVTLDKFPKY